MGRPPVRQFYFREKYDFGHLCWAYQILEINPCLWECSHSNEDLSYRGPSSLVTNPGKRRNDRLAWPAVHGQLYFITKFILTAVLLLVLQHALQHTKHKACTCMQIDYRRHTWVPKCTGSLSLSQLELAGSPFSMLRRRSRNSPIPANPGLDSTWSFRLKASSLKASASRPPYVLLLFASCLCSAE